jgi:hypothetical protein
MGTTAAYHRHVPVHPATDATGHDLVSGGVSGELPGGAGQAIDLSLEELEREARRVIGEMAYAYFAGGADDERLLAGNIEAWARWQLHPRVLAGIAGVDLSTTLLGTAVSSPVVIAPTAVQRLAHGEGETATARGAAAVGALMVLSSLASCSLEEVAAAAPGAPRWMQVYILRDRARTVDLVQRPPPTATARSSSPSIRRCRASASGSCAAGSACRRIWLCPTWPGAARSAPTTAG